MNRVLPAAAKGGLEDDLEIARANWYFDRLASIYMGNGISVLGLTLALLLLGAGGAALIWAAFGLGHILLCRTWTYWPSRRPVVDVDSARFWGRYLTASSVLQGLVWGAAPLAFMAPGDASAAAAVTLVLVANVGAGIALLASHWRAYVAFAVPALLPLAAVHGQHALSSGAGLVSVQVMLMVMTLALLVTCLLLARDTARIIDAALRLRLEKERFSEQLAEQVAIAEAAVRDKDQFMAAASHDLRQPLAALNLFLAQMDTHADAAGRMILLRSRQALGRLNALVDGLLSLSRWEGTALQAEISAFPLDALLEELRSEFAPQAERHGVALRIARSGAWVRSDRLHLQRMVANLIGNALRYCPGGRVAVGVRWRAAGWVLQVRDNGPGIPESEHERVFAPFAQLGNPQRNPDQGSGLGLAIVRRIAEVIGAPVKLESAVGAGTLFEIELARCEPVPAGRGSQVEARQAELPLVMGVVNLDVLVIEDDADVRKGMVSLLESWGCRVLAVADGDAALAIQASELARLDLMLCDQRLPGERDGLTAIRELRCRAERPIPAAIITGEALSGIATAADEPPIRLLRKPLRPPQLRLLLGSFVGTPMSAVDMAAGD